MMTSLVDDKLDLGAWLYECLRQVQKLEAYRDAFEDFANGKSNIALAAVHRAGLDNPVNEVVVEPT